MRSPRTAMKSSPRSPQLEKACTQQQRPNAAKNKFKKKIKKETAGILHHPQTTHMSYLLTGMVWLFLTTGAFWCSSLDLHPGLVTCSGLQLR